MFSVYRQFNWLATGHQIGSWTKSWMMIDTIISDSILIFNLTYIARSVFVNVVPTILHTTPKFIYRLSALRLLIKNHCTPMSILRNHRIFSVRKKATIVCQSIRLSILYTCAHQWCPLTYFVLLLPTLHVYVPTWFFYTFWFPWWSLAVRKKEKAQKINTIEINWYFLFKSKIKWNVVA